MVIGVLLGCAACSSKLEGPSPGLADADSLPVAPAVACGEQLTTVLDVNGARFAPVPVNVPAEPVLALPTVRLSRSAALDGSSADAVEVIYGGDPTSPSNTDALRWLDDAHMQVTLDQQLTVDGETARLPAGIYDARVINPNGNAADAASVLAVVDRPMVTEMTPALLCLSDAERELSLTGSGLLRIGAASPRLARSDSADSFDVSMLEDCSTIAQEQADAELCSGARVALAAGSIEPGLHSLELTNPETAACHTEEALQLRVVGAPVVESVEAQAVCSRDGTQPIVIHIHGSGFLQVDEALPTVMLADQTVAVNGLADCETLETPGLSVRSCKQIELSFEVAEFEPGDIRVAVENPAPAGCGAAANAVLRLVAPPQITRIRPTELCSKLATTFTVEGEGFDRAASVMIGDIEAAVTFVSDTALEVSVDGLEEGKHAFSVTNLGSCAVSVPEALLVEPSPIVFNAEPPVIYGEIPVEVTISTSGLATTATQVELVRRGGDEREVLAFTSPERPNQIYAQVPAGLAPGRWDVVITNAGGCPGTLAGGLLISSERDDALVSSIKPSYASTTEDTAVTISGAGFSPVPRVYLSATSASGTATALRAVEVKSDGSSLTAVIPRGIAPNTYDLIVVNPDGAFDVLDGGVTITAAAPPVVTRVTPASLPSNAASVPITLTGTGFRADLAVELDCVTSGGANATIATTPLAPSADGTSVVANVTIGDATPISVDAGSICVVKLTNADGAFFEYSAFSITNPSYNLSAWKSAESLVTARRALALVAGRPTATSRYLYALGGDEGGAQPTARGAEVFDSVESSQVDVFGGMAGWFTQRNRLIAPRSGAGAANIGRFVYMVGGHNGTSATATLQRASILNPLAGPEVSGIDAALSDGEKGLGQGLYYYRVSAVMVDDDASNPAGETLPGEPMPVQLPDRDELITLSLDWAPVPNAHAYRVYRSPAPGALPSELELLGEVSCGTPGTACDCEADASRCRFTDEGGETTAGRVPLPPGSLGRWHEVEGGRCSSASCALSSAREGLTVAAVSDPADASRHYLYAFGGRDESGVYLDSYEVATVSVAADGSQTVSGFVAGADSLASPRADHGVWVMSQLNSDVIARSATPDDVWIYVGGGRTTGDTPDNTLEAGELGPGADGQLSAFASTDALSGGLVGFGVGASNDQLYTFGGVPGTGDASSAKLCDSSVASCSPLPDLAPGAFNSLGGDPPRRMFGGSTQESAFFFLVGGHDGTNVLKTSESTVQ